MVFADVIFAMHFKDLVVSQAFVCSKKTPQTKAIAALITLFSYMHRERDPVKSDCRGSFTRRAN